jgi:hypothetical protein
MLHFNSEDGRVTKITRGTTTEFFRAVEVAIMKPSEEYMLVPSLLLQ